MNNSYVELAKRIRNEIPVVRNVYTFNLSSEKMKGLLDVLPGVWNDLRIELLAFADYLDVLAGEE